MNDRALFTTVFRCRYASLFLYRWNEELFYARITAKVIGSSLAFGVDGGGRINGHATNGIFGHGLGSFHEVIFGFG